MHTLKLKPKANSANMPGHMRKKEPDQKITQSNLGNNWRNVGRGRNHPNNGTMKKQEHKRKSFIRIDINHYHGITLLFTILNDFIGMPFNRLTTHKLGLENFSQTKRAAFVDPKLTATAIIDVTKFTQNGNKRLEEFFRSNYFRLTDFLVACYAKLSLHCK